MGLRTSKLLKASIGSAHTLAAIGYFEEHDAPWLFRRVHGDVTRLRSLPRAAGDVGDVLVEGTGSLPAADLGEVGEAFRAEVRALFGAFADRLGGSTMDLDRELVQAVADRGWLGFAWPESAGGRGAAPAEQVVLNEETAYQRTPISKALGAVMLLGNSILKHGTQEQQSTFLPLIRRGELSFCLGYSEPEAGSDLASLRTRAVRDDGGTSRSSEAESGGRWVINGQKLWTTGGHASDWVWLAVRTDPDGALGTKKGSLPASGQLGEEKLTRKAATSAVPSSPDRFEQHRHRPLRPRRHRRGRSGPMLLLHAGLECESAVDREDGAGHEGRLPGCQEQGRVRDVPTRSLMAHRDHRGPPGRDLRALTETVARQRVRLEATARRGDPDRTIPTTMR